VKKIEWYIDKVEEETGGAQCYAEKYILNKGWSSQWGGMYADMAADEIKHAEYIMRIADEHIKMLTYVPEADSENWEHCKRRAVEKIAAVRLMLSK
jgi:hypothetical protein